MNLYHLKMRIKSVDWINHLYQRITKRDDKDDAKKVIALQEQGYQVAEEIEKLLSAVDVTFFLAFGNLLGIIRDGHFMSWDNDVDYGICIGDSFTWDSLERLMNSAGYQKTRQFRYRGEVTEQTYAKGELTVDFFDFAHRGDVTTAYCYYRKDKFIYNSSVEMHVRRFDLTRISGTRVLEAEGRSFHIPNEAEQLLAGVYSDNWRTPDPNWVAGAGPACTSLDDTEIACLELF